MHAANRCDNRPGHEPEGRLYDLIVTELNLYGLNGLPFISRFRRWNWPKSPKIVILSEQRVGSTIEHCFQQGVIDYIRSRSRRQIGRRIRTCF